LVLPHRPAAGRGPAPPHLGPAPPRRTPPEPHAGPVPRLGPSRSTPAPGLRRAATTRGMRGIRCTGDRTPRPPYPFFLAAAVPRALPQPPLHLPTLPVPLRRRAVARSRGCATADPPCAPAIRPRHHRPSASNRRRSILGGKDRAVPLLPFLFPLRKQVSVDAVS
jgi:hypothetical protein